MIVIVAKRCILIGYIAITYMNGGYFVLLFLEPCSEIKFEILKTFALIYIYFGSIIIVEWSPFGQ